MKIILLMALVALCACQEKPEETTPTEEIASQPRGVPEIVKHHTWESMDEQNNEPWVHVVLFTDNYALHLFYKYFGPGAGTEIESLLMEEFDNPEEVSDGLLIMPSRERPGVIEEWTYSFTDYEFESRIEVCRSEGRCRTFICDHRAHDYTTTWEPTIPF